MEEKVRVCQCGEVVILAGRTNRMDGGWLHRVDASCYELSSVVDLKGLREVCCACGLVPIPQGLGAIRFNGQMHYRAGCVDEKPELASDLVNHPPHYTSSPAKCSGCGKAIECIDIVRHMMFDPGNVVKYIWRRVFGGKVGEQNVEGLEKAVFYLQDEIKRLKEAN